MGVGDQISKSTTRNVNEDRVRNHQLASYYRLSTDEKRLVEELRSRVKDQLTTRYDTDFNLYRWIKLVERTTKKGIIDSAEKLLRNHLRYRKSLNLDSDDIATWDRNPLFVNRILPRGYLHYLPSNNRYIWWVDYSEIDVEGILNTYSSRDILTWHLWKFEQILRVVNEREKETGAMSGVCGVLDVRNLSLTHGFMSSVKSGHMNYTTQLLHYEHYPELTYPVHIINVSKILMVPYKIVRPFMPHDFTDKFRISDSNFKRDLLEQMTEAELPEQLGGKNPLVQSPSSPGKLDASNYYYQRQKREGASDIPAADEVCHIHLPARKKKILQVECQAGSTLTWRIEADAEITFGLFFLPAMTKLESEPKNCDKMELLEKMEMVVPNMLVVTKVPEKGSHRCTENGTYNMLLCNNYSWICRRHIQAKIEVDGDVKKDLSEL